MLATSTVNVIFGLAARSDLVVPLTNNKTHGPHSFAVSGTSVWNSLPLAVSDLELTPCDCLGNKLLLYINMLIIIIIIIMMMILMMMMMMIIVINLL